MTTDQHIAIWGVVGTWLSGFATVAAVVVALWSVRVRDQIKLKVEVGRRLIFMGDGSPPLRYVGWRVTNLGERPVIVESVGWRVGPRRKRRHCMQLVGTTNTARPPIQLAHGASADFLVEEDDDSWAKELMEKFVERASDLSTLEAYVATSVGQTVYCKPEASLIAYLGKHAPDSSPVLPQTAGKGA